MSKLIDYLYEFEHRLVYAIYDIQTDFKFASMGRVAIALDLGFTAEQTGVVENIVPHPFRTVEEVEQFHWNISPNSARLQKELIRISGWPKDSTIHRGGGCFGPLTVAACIIGIEECSRMVIKKPAVLRAVLRRVTDYMILLAKEEEKLGVKSFWIAEPVASLLSPKSCMKFCVPYIKEIYDAIQIPGILHVCGNTDRHTQALLATGAEALSIDWCTNLADCIAQVPEDVVIMGNISPMLLWTGTQEEVRAQTTSLLEQVRNYKNFVMATGCQVPSMAPRENVQLMIDLAKKASVWNNDQYRRIACLSKCYCEGGKAAFIDRCNSEGVAREIAEAALDVARRRLSVQEQQNSSLG